MKDQTSTTSVFVYEMRSRPPCIGTHPTDGLIGHEEGGDRYGFLKYSRELSQNEAYDFELRRRPDLSPGYVRFDATPGENVRFVPYSPKCLVTEGVLREEIKGAHGDSRGWHIFSPQPLDPHRVVRVWEEDGILEPGLQQEAGVELATGLFPSGDLPGQVRGTVL